MSSNNITQQYEHLFNQQSPHHLNLAMIDYLQSYNHSAALSFTDQISSLPIAAQQELEKTLDARGLIDTINTGEVINIPVRILGYIYDLDTALALLKQGNGTAREAVSNKYYFSYQDIQPAYDLKDMIQTQINEARNTATAALPANQNKEVLASSTSLSSELNKPILLSEHKDAKSPDDEAITLQIFNDEHLAIQMSRALNNDDFFPYQENDAISEEELRNAPPISSELNPSLPEDLARQSPTPSLAPSTIAPSTILPSAQSRNMAAELIVEESDEEEDTTLELLHFDEAEETIAEGSPYMKLVVVGDRTSDKDRLIYRILHNHNPVCSPIITENQEIRMPSSRGPVVIGVWNTGGQEEYDRLRPLSYSNTDVFLLTYSAGDVESFNHVKTKWAPELKAYCPDTPIVLVACNIEQREARGQQSISTAQGEQLAHEIGATYIECSAQTGVNVRQVFATAVQSVFPPEAPQTIAPMSRQSSNRAITLTQSFLGLFNQAPNPGSRNLATDLEEFITKKARGGSHSSVIDRIRGVDKNIQISAAQSLLANLKGAQPPRKFSLTAIDALLTGELGDIVKKDPAIVSRIRNEWREPNSVIRDTVSSMRSGPSRF